MSHGGSGYWGGKGSRVPPLTAKFCQKSGGNQKKSGKNQEKSGKKEEKSGRKGKNWEVSFTLPLLTDKAGYATAWRTSTLSVIIMIHTGCMY